MTLNNLPTKPNKVLARQIINAVGSNGQPPVCGYQYFSVGLDKYISVLEKHYLIDYLSEGGSAFKLVIGSYGSGKTHFLYTMQGLSWGHNFATSYISLGPSTGSFYKLDDVYRLIANELTYPQPDSPDLEKGIESFLKAWFNQKYDELSEKFSENEITYHLNGYIDSLSIPENKSFEIAIKTLFKIYAEEYGNNDDQDIIIAWLKGENPPKSMLKKYHIFEKIDKTTAFKMIRSLISLVRSIGYSGLIILMDEAENTPSLSSKQKIMIMQNLRELIDSCSKGSLRNAMIFYTIPDIDLLLNGPDQIYTALNQRLSTIFYDNDIINPDGVRLDLASLENENNLNDHLMEIGIKLAEIYEIAYGYSFSQSDLDHALNIAITEANENMFGEISYKRTFVQACIREFGNLNPDNH